jgi:hypothetical protein
MVVACLALLVALGGTSVAAVSQLVPRNSVGTAQLRDNAVARVKVRNNAINSSKVQNRSLLAVDFANGQIPAGPAGPAGSAGPAGPAGAAGVAGPPGVSGYEIVESSLTVTSQFITSHTVNCPAGKRALGGGVRSNTLSFAGPYLVNSNPTAGGAGWTASFAREVQSSWTYVVYAICGVVTT